MFGDRHHKQYFVEGHTCAVVIRSIAVLDNMLRLVSFFVCVFVSLVVYFHYTTPNIGVLYIHKNKNIRNVTRCRDSRSAKSIENR